MADIVVTVPKGIWNEWLLEGDLAGETASGQLYGYSVSNLKPDIKPGERVYIVAYGKLRGYAPLVRLDWTPNGRWHLIRGGDAVAVTIYEKIPGFRGYRYRWWPRGFEVPFPNWKVP